MIKRGIVLVCLAAVVLSGIMFYWPQSFTKVIDENADIYIQHTEHVYDIVGGVKFETVNTSIEIKAGSEQFTEFMDILSKYSYHRSLRAYFGDSSISGRGNETIGIYASPDSIHNNGLKEILIGTKVYHLDYWGNKKSQSMIEDIKHYIQGKDM